ncbi:ArnT family glycosyltransferase [Nocardia camponoti]|uniref:Glycosyltransferase n=1 Tax=Nocardia camponoti TaxID=1616106 RepID=A0A917VDY0_9NOCA|nr:glycosyltransferase family 39 protein [Nocardia camponoti]GGK65187.1 putative glycosyltransferase [Nocardia camponoti]
MTDSTASPPESPPTRDSRLQWLGLAALLVGTAGAYLWNLSANGWANTFYAAAVEAGSHSWKAFFFGSLDASNAITVDKTPLSFWPMEISARIFGMNSWSMLVPQVLLGVASVALLWAIVRRHYGANAGLLAGLLLAVTPVATLMFRFNNPDAMLVLLMLAAVWAMSRALLDGRWRWLALCGMFVGLGFLAKQLQVLLVLPVLAVAYLLFGPPKLGKRVAQLLVAGVAMVAGAGWWVLIAQLWPAGSRPYFGGSQHNSIIELTLGYNGLDRLSGGSREHGGFGGPAGANPDMTGAPGMPGGASLPSGGGNPAGAAPDMSGMGMPGGRSPFGQAGITRMFSESVGGQIAWLIPAAAILFIAGLIATRRAPRTDPRRAVLALFGIWAAVSAIVFSLMSGTFHQYYTVALAPALAGTVAAGVGLLWPSRTKVWVRATFALAVAATAATAWVLLNRTPDFVPWLRWVIVVVAIGAIGALAVSDRAKLAVVAVLASLFVGVAGPVAYSIDTLNTAHTGSIPLAGPRSGNSEFGGFGGGSGRNRDGNAGAPNGTEPPTASHGMPGMGNEKMSDKVVAMLDQNHAQYRWAAATVSSMAQGPYQLGSDGEVMAIGGFSGGDPSPTLDQFKQYVSNGDIHYFIAANQARPGRAGTDSEASKITAWVKENYQPTEVDGVTLYDLTHR